MLAYRQVVVLSMGHLAVVGLLAASAAAQDPLDVSPLKKGDKIEVRHAGNWVPAEFLEPSGDHTIRAVYYPFTSGARVSLTLARSVLPRTWGDASGKFTLEGALVRIVGKEVVILGDDGREVTVPIARLRKEDREYLGTFPHLAANIKTAEEKEAEEFQEPKIELTQTQLGEAPLVEASRITSAAWTYQPDAADEPALPLRVRVPLPGTATSRFVRRILLLPADKSAFIVSGSPRNSWGIDVQAVNLASGRVVSGRFSKQAEPVAISDDGKLILARSVGPAGSATELRLYRREGNKATPEKAWVPYLNRGGQPAEDLRSTVFADESAVIWSDIVGSDRVLSLSQSGELAVWATADLKPLAQAVLPRGHHVAISPGKKYVAAAALEGVALLETADLKPAGFLPTEVSFFTRLAFSPSGKQLAVADNNRLQVWDLSTQQLVKDFPLESSVTFPGEGASLAWADERFLLAGTHITKVVDLANYATVWTYKMGPWLEHAGRTWFVTRSLTTTLYTASVPSPELRKQCDQLKPEDVLAIRPEMEVALELQTTDSHTAEVRERLVAALTERGLKIVPQSDVKLIGAIGTRAPVARPNTPAGSTPAQSSTPMASLSYVVDGETVWQSFEGGAALRDIRGGEVIYDSKSELDSRIFERMWIPVTVPRPDPDADEKSSYYPT